MTTITILQEIVKKGDLVIIPRQEYEELLKRQKVIPVAKLTLAEKKVLERSRKEMARGEYVTLEELQSVARRKRM